MTLFGVQHQVGKKKEESKYLRIKPKKTDSQHLVGGTLTMAFNDIWFRISDQGCDSRDLEQWSYITLTGKNGLQTSIYTCYFAWKSNSVGLDYAQ